MRYFILSLVFLFVSCSSDTTEPIIQVPVNNGTIQGHWVGTSGIITVHLEGPVVKVDIGYGPQVKQSTIRISGNSVWFNCLNPVNVTPSDVLTFEGTYDGTVIDGRMMLSYQNEWRPLTLRRQ